MYKAGGIIAIIAGIFGIFAAGFTLLFGGVASALKADGGSTVVALGWGGVGFSFLTIIFGAMALSRVRWAGIGIIICAIAGAILGGTLVAVFMALSLIGGILATIDSKTKNDTNKPILANQLSTIHNESAQLIPASIQQEVKKKNGLVIGGALLLICLIGSAAYFAGKKQTGSNTTQKTTNSKVETKRDIKSETPQKDMLEAGRCLFILEGKESLLMTMEALQGKGVTLADKNSCAEWIKNDPIIETVFAIQSIDGKNGKYIIKSGSAPETKVFPKEFEVHIVAENEEEKSLIENTSKFQGIRIKGKLVTDVSSSFHTLNPAFIIPLEKKTVKSELPDNKENSNKSAQANQQAIAPTGAEAQAINASKPTPITSNSTAYQVCNLDPNGENFLSLKTEPNGSSARVLKMTDGTTLSLLDKNGEWYQVQMTNGKTGWANSKWLCQANGQQATTEKTTSITSSNQPIAPSFNCQNASARVEKMICNSEELSKLDVQLSDVYKTALSADANKELIKQQQNNWRKNIRDACALDPCVKTAYKNRIAELFHFK